MLLRSLQELRREISETYMPKNKRQPSNSEATHRASPSTAPGPRYQESKLNIHGFILICKRHVLEVILIRLVSLLQTHNVEVAYTRHISDQALEKRGVSAVVAGARGLVVEYGELGWRRH